MSQLHILFFIIGLSVFLPACAIGSAFATVMT